VHQGADETPADIAELRALYPSWAFDIIYATAGSGPDGRRIQAKRGTVTLSAESAGEMVGRLERQPRD
jgi:hypothetical protein